MPKLVRSIAGEFRRYRSLAERALVPLPNGVLHRALHPEGNSIAILMQHLGGNLSSRFHDLLHTDGETSWRNRDREFDDRRLSDSELHGIWQNGWETLERSLDGLTDSDLTRTITIRRVPLSVADALARSLAHVAYHTGQIVLIAQAHSGSAWENLSVKRGGSAAYANAPALEKPPTPTS